MELISKTANKLVFTSIVVVMFSLPFAWVFHYPWDEESPYFIALAILAPIAAYLYMVAQQRIKIIDGNIITRSFLAIVESKPIAIAQVSEIEHQISARSYQLNFRLTDGKERYVFVGFLEYEQIAELLYEILRINSQVKIPEKFAKLVANFKDKEKVPELVRQINRQDSQAAYRILIGAVVMGLFYAIFRMWRGESVSLREVVESILYMIH